MTSLRVRTGPGRFRRWSRKAFLKQARPASMSASPGGCGDQLAGQGGCSEQPAYAGKPSGGYRFSVHKRVSVVVDVGLSQMLGLRILVRFVLMVDRGMAVLVIVSAHHVLPARPVTMVVNDVSVLMTMHDGVMMMHRHCSCISNRCVCLAVAM